MKTKKENFPETNFFFLYFFSPTKAEEKEIDVCGPPN